MRTNLKSQVFEYNDDTSRIAVEAKIRVFGFSVRTR